MKQKQNIKKGERFNKITNSIIRALASDWFFITIIALFVISAGWIAISGTFPLIFDEEYHMGVIEIYSRGLTPFLQSQPPEAAMYGDLTRFHSYLFHYLMSFPYRLIALFTDDLKTQVIIMRFINIAFVSIGIWLYRKVLLYGGVSKHLTHVVLLFFTAVPLVAYVAAHVNYDNFIFMLLPVMFYSVLRILKNDDRQIIWLLILITAGSVASAAKFSGLPLFMATALYALGALVIQHKRHVLSHLWKQATGLSKKILIPLLLVSVLSVGIFAERHVGNLVTYGTIRTRCHHVHSHEQCMDNAVYRRNHNMVKRFQEGQWDTWSPYEYTKNRWVPHIFNDLFVTAAYVDGEVALHRPLGELRAHGGNTYLRWTGWVMFVVGIVSSIFLWRRLPARNMRYLFLVTFILYATALWLTNYGDYTRYGVAVATQGRYFIPLLIPVMAISAMAVSYLLKKRTLKLLVFALLVIMSTQGGGGAMNYILYSGKDWNWQDNQRIIDINSRTEQVLKQTIIVPPPHRW